MNQVPTPESGVSPDAPAPADAMPSESAPDGGSPALQQMWRSARERLSTAVKDPEAVERLVKVASHPREIEALTRLLSAPKPKQSGVVQDPLKLLYQNVDDSDAPLSDWLMALADLQSWTETQGRRTTLRSALGYLACCDAAVKTQNDLDDLPSTVRAMLEEYGFDG